MPLKYIGVREMAQILQPLAPVNSVIRVDAASMDSNPLEGMFRVVPVSDVRAIFNALAEDSLVRVLSSPSLMVLDNEAASIQVGDEVPVVTRQQQSITDSSQRTELVLVPSVVFNSNDNRRVVESFRAKLQGLKGSF